MTWLQWFLVSTCTCEPIKYMYYTSTGNSLFLVKSCQLFPIDIITDSGGTPQLIVCAFSYCLMSSGHMASCYDRCTGPAQGIVVGFDLTDLCWPQPNAPYMYMWSLQRLVINTGCAEHMPIAMYIRYTQCVPYSELGGITGVIPGECVAGGCVCVCVCCVSYDLLLYGVKDHSHMRCMLTQPLDMGLCAICPRYCPQERMRLQEAMTRVQREVLQLREERETLQVAVQVSQREAAEARGLWETEIKSRASTSLRVSHTLQGIMILASLYIFIFLWCAGIGAGEVVSGGGPFHWISEGPIYVGTHIA